MEILPKKTEAARQSPVDVGGSSPVPFCDDFVNLGARCVDVGNVLVVQVVRRPIQSQLCASLVRKVWIPTPWKIHMDPENHWVYGGRRSFAISVRFFPGDPA